MIGILLHLKNLKFVHSFDIGYNELDTCRKVVNNFKLNSYYFKSPELDGEHFELLWFGITANLTTLINFIFEKLNTDNDSINANLHCIEV